MSKYITTPIYYVNDKPHIGHAYTTVAADVLTRYYRMLGEEVFLLTGTDEHGSKVAETAQQNNKTPQKFVDVQSALFQMMTKRLEIANNDFIRTTEPRHQKVVQQFLQKLFDQGDIYQGIYEGLYCAGCEKFMTEKELVNGKCPDHQKAPQKIKEKNYFFKLEKYLPQVAKLIEEDKIKILPAERKKEVSGLIKQGLADFSVSREKVAWGIPLPFDQNQKCYVWVDALQNYISALGYGQDKKKFKKWWTDSQVIHLLGKDILKFHTIYWPAMLLAAGVKVPDTLFIHGYFTINGQKMSKSLGNVIAPDELIDKFGVDAARYLLLSQFPFGVDGDISQNKLIEKYNADLANGLGNLTARVIALAEKKMAGQVPPSTKPLKNHQPLVEVVGQLIANFRFYEAINKILEIIKSADDFIEKNKVYKMADKEIQAPLYCLLETIRQLAWLVLPIMPNIADKIFSQLGLDPVKEKNKSFKEAINWGGLKPGTKVIRGEALFPRL